MKPLYHKYVGVESVSQKYYALPPCHNIVRIGFRKSQTSLTLTKFIEKIIYIYNTECIPYLNMLDDESDSIDLRF
jgi:hypothetical protein